MEVVAAVFSRNSRVLCLRRSEGRSLSGFWEFPGGKVEAGETLQDALVREIQEELGVEIMLDKYLGESLHSINAGSITPTDNKQPDKQTNNSDKRSGVDQIRLHAFLVKTWSGQIRPVDHDQMLWASTTQMPALNWSPADIPFVDLLCAPSSGLQPDDTVGNLTR